MSKVRNITATITDTRVWVKTQDLEVEFESTDGLKSLVPSITVEGSKSLSWLTKAMGRVLVPIAMKLIIKALGRVVIESTPQTLVKLRVNTPDVTAEATHGLYKGGRSSIKVKDFVTSLTAGDVKGIQNAVEVNAAGSYLIVRVGNMKEVILFDYVFEGDYVKASYAKMDGVEMHNVTLHRNTLSELV